MAEAQAGQGNAQAQGDEEQQGQQQGNNGQPAQDGADGSDGQQPKGQQAARTYSQEELDRILGKVRKNARYLGRKEAEAELRSQGATAQQARDTVDRQQEQAKDDAPPQQKDGESWEQFVERKAEFAGRKAAREERAAATKEENARKAEERRASTEREFKKRAEETKKDIPDLYDVLESAEEVMISNAMGEAIQESPIGPRILYHLVKNPAEAARIAGLSPNAAAREIGKLEATLEAGIKKAAAPKDDDGEDGNAQGDDKGGNKDTAQERRGDGTFKAKKPAPDPIEPGSARSANATAAPSDKDDMKTWVAKREAEVLAPIRRRR